jgi:asparagine synthase (glutamine-hydrolysing)
MGYILGYLEEIIRRWGSKTYLSGDGGDDCLKVTGPKLTFSSLDEVIEYIIEKETCMAPDRAEAILKLPPGTLRQELLKLFGSYPERVFARRIKHFKIFERGRRFYFEGEDRTRSFLWQDSPFYSLALFRHCMSVPDRLKHYNVFCRHALLALSPAAAGVPVTPVGYAPGTWEYAVYHRVKGMLLSMPEPMLSLAKRLAGIPPEPAYIIPSEFTAYLLDQLSHDTPLAALLDANQVPRGLKEINEHSFFCFWSVAMLEKAYRGRLG